MLFGLTAFQGLQLAMGAVSAIESERRVLVKDIDTLGRNMNLEKGATKLAALIEVERGKNAQRASFFNAVSTMGNAYINMKKT